MENLYNNPITKKTKVKKIKKEITQKEITNAMNEFLQQGGVITQLDSLSESFDFTFKTTSVKEQINKNLTPN